MVVEVDEDADGRNEDEPEGCDQVLPKGTDPDQGWVVYRSIFDSLRILPSIPSLVIRVVERDAKTNEAE